MRLFRHWTGLPADARGAVVALGNFDGVHLGHAAVVGAAAAEAARLGAPLAALTFEPHPRSLFRPQDPPFRLTLLRAKAHALAELGVDILYVLHFDRAFSTLTAEDFVAEVLVAGLGLRHAVCGPDFVFGHGRGGNLALLRSLGERAGFGVTAVAPALSADGAAYSSTAVRKALEAGELERATALLGRPWEIEGRVEHGDARGRKLGFPTANILLGEHLEPRRGVYAVMAGIDEGAATIWHPGVANIGRRPTIANPGDPRPLLEAHLFDFAGDLYGRHLRVRLVGFVRDEKRFPGLDALTAQIAEDCRTARRMLGQD
ncbi:MAG: bifunctional riboflavin kinase/FAD synthetase [Alphaproteobacteria bacterium]|nr:bifunctional riboflavin kinase/FAD synthetase [Alphaproteobacteria bacterium]